MNMEKEDSPAQTASVGDREMMTYMKLPIPSPMTDTANGAPPSNADSDDQRFFDGLFERLSGSSDNGSDKGKEEGSSFLSSGDQGVSVGSEGGLNKGTSMNNGMTSGSSGSGSGSLTALNLSNRYIQSASTGNGNTSNDAQGSVTLPQHLMLSKINTSHTTYLPQNLLNPMGHIQNQLQAAGVGVSCEQQQAQVQVQQAQVQSLPQNHNHRVAPQSQLGTVPVNVMDVNVNGMQHYNVGANVNVNVNSWMNVNAPGPASPLQQAQINTQTQAQAQAQAQAHSQAHFSNPLIAPSPAPIAPSLAIPNIPIPQHPASASAPTPAPAPTSLQPNQNLNVSPFKHQISQQSAQVPDRVQSINTFKHPASKISKGPVPGYTSAKRPLVSSISEDESETEKRRRDRNQREQERSQRIANQIAELKSLLTMSNVPFKSDKFSTLVSVHEYICTLQQRSALLDAEQKKLVKTIARSNDIVNQSQHGQQAAGSTSSTTNNTSEIEQISASGHVIIPTNAPPADEDELLVFVRGLDYKSVFGRIRVALCVLSIDGRLLNCNEEFIRICKMSRSMLVGAGLRPPAKESEEEVKIAGKTPMSLFSLVSREDMQKVFTAMGSMLKVAHQPAEGASKQDIQSRIKNDHWSCEIGHCHNFARKVRLNISLVRIKQGTPRFFNCALTEPEEQSF